MSHRILFPTAAADTGTASIAIELSNKGWLVGVVSPGASSLSRHRLAARDLAALIALGEREIERGAKRVVYLYEAGRDGFWLQRALEEDGFECVVMDAASLPVNRRRRRAKTDRLDLDGLMRALLGWLAGDGQACRMVAVPSLADEDLRRTGRERHGLIAERVRHTNRIAGLLIQLGIAGFEPLPAGARERLAELRAPAGEAVPPAMARQIGRELDRLDLVVAQIRIVEAERDRMVKRPAPDDAQAARIAQLMQLKAIGIETANVLGREVFWRHFANRRHLAAYVGLCPSPWASGEMEREQGISKAGNARARVAMVELAWRWLRWQPDSLLARQFRERVGVARGRVRRIAIVALARKLLVALWRFLTTGLIPEGAVLS